MCWIDERDLEYEYVEQDFYNDNDIDESYNDSDDGQWNY